MSVRINKAFRPGIQAAEAAGWVFDITKNGHYRLTPPEPVWWGEKRVVQIVFSATTSDHRAVKNFEADLRRSGIKA